MELFIASLCFSLGASIVVWLSVNAQMKKRADARAGEVGGGTLGDFDITAIETRLSDLASELSHVANSHTNAVEDRRNELKRVIEMSNDRIRKLNMLMSDLDIIEKRLRERVAEAVDTFVEDARVGDARASDARAGGDTRDADLVREVPRRRAGASEGAARGGRSRQETHSEVRSLAADGLNSAEIASRLRLQQSEVEMVMRATERRQQ